MQHSPNPVKIAELAEAIEILRSQFPTAFIDALYDSSSYTVKGRLKVSVVARLTGMTVHQTKAALQAARIALGGPRWD